MNDIAGLGRGRTRQVLCNDDEIDAANYTGKLVYENYQRQTHDSFSFAITSADEQTAAAPPMSPRMSFIPADGMMLMLPESDVLPLPTNASVWRSCPLPRDNGRAFFESDDQVSA